MKKILGGIALAVITLILIIAIAEVWANFVSFLRPFLFDLFHGERWVNLSATAIAVILILILAIIYAKLISRIGKNSIKGKRAVLVGSGGDIKYLALFMGETDIVKIDGTKEKNYILYAPSTPMPVSGFPVIFVPKNSVTLTFTNLSLADVSSILTSFGLNCPKEIKEIKKS
jgi:uncharacterized membrane protein